MKKTSNNLEKEMENPVIYINIYLSDKRQGYGSFEFVVRLNTLKELVDKYSRLSKVDPGIEQKSFEEFVNSRFRPWVNVEKFTTNAMNYFCSLKELQTNQEKFLSKGCTIEIKIDIDHIERTSIELSSKQKDPDYYIEPDYVFFDGWTDVLMSCISKLDFLTPVELDYYLDLLTYIQNNEDYKCTLSNEEIRSLMFKDKMGLYNDEEECLWDIEYLHERLLFYGIIEFKFIDGEDDNQHRREITIPDLEAASELFGFVEL